MARAVALLYVDLTQSSETGTVWGLLWHNQGKGRVCWEVRIGQAGKVREQGGERPMGTGWKGFEERARVNDERLIGAANFRQQ